MENKSSVHFSFQFFNTFATVCEWPISSMLASSGVAKMAAMAIIGSLMRENPVQSVLFPADRKALRDQEIPAHIFFSMERMGRFVTWSGCRSQRDPTVWRDRFTRLDTPL